jgi:hypothetical protein
MNPEIARMAPNSNEGREKRRLMTTPTTRPRLRPGILTAALLALSAGAASARPVQKEQVSGAKSSISAPAPAASAAPPGPPVAEASKVKVERGAGGHKVYRITEEIRIEGKIQKPEAFFFYQKSSISYDWQEMKKDFIPRILESVSKAPF